MTDNSHDEIQRLAYEYWERSAGLSNAEENWKKAERQIRSIGGKEWNESIAKAGQALKPVSELAKDLLPLFTSISGLFTLSGPILLYSYLESVEAPFPTPDSTFLSLVFLVPSVLPERSFTLHFSLCSHSCLLGPTGEYGIRIAHFSC